MSERSVDDETLMAFADGETDAATGAAVARAMSTDPAVAARVAMFLQTRAVLAESARVGTPVPDALLARVRAILARARPIAPTRRGRAALARSVRAARSRGIAPPWPTAIAAAIALAAGVGLGSWLSPIPAQRPPGELAYAGAPADPVLGAALDALLSGERQTLRDGSEVAVVTSFHDGTGELCREIEQRGIDGAEVAAIVCRQNDGWAARLTVAAASARGAYVPASSVDVIDAYLEAVEAGPPLGPEDEASALLVPRMP